MTAHGQNILLVNNPNSQNYLVRDVTKLQILNTSGMELSENYHHTSEYVHMLMSYLKTLFNVEQVQIYEEDHGIEVDEEECVSNLTEAAIQCAP
jgi:hypothetical protein